MMPFPDAAVSPPDPGDPHCVDCGKNLAEAPDAVWCETALANEDADPLCEACCELVYGRECEHCTPPVVEIVATRARHEGERSGQHLFPRVSGLAGSFPLHIIGQRVVECARCPRTCAEDHLWSVIGARGRVCGACVEELRDGAA